MHNFTFKAMLDNDKEIKRINQEIDKLTEEVKWINTPPKQKIKILNKQLDDLFYQYRKDRTNPQYNDMTRYFIEFNYNNAREEILKQINKIKRRMNPNPKGDITEDDVRSAKLHPVNLLIEFNRAGFALCIAPAHDDRRPSMHWNKKNNTVKCFSCGWGGDSIDILMIQNQNITFIEAVKILINL